jgi:hypothetical protein
VYREKTRPRAKAGTVKKNGRDSPLGEHGPFFLELENEVEQIFLAGENLRGDARHALSSFDFAAPLCYFL